jgi:hypothetical protein
MDYEALKTRQRTERDAWPENLGLRVHRALSWLGRAEKLDAQDDDLDGQFVFLWVAFNAAYATEIDEKHQRESEQQTFRAFLQKLSELDASRKRFDALVWTEFPKSIRVLLDNRYVFADFWQWQNGTLPESEYKSRFDAANRAGHKALGKQDTVTVLSIVLSRIYVLRNQLVHGGATWGSSVNRDQLRDCTRFMAKLVPLVIEIMMDHPRTLWGPGTYPVVKG